MLAVLLVRCGSVRLGAEASFSMAALVLGFAGSVRAARVPPGYPGGNQRGIPLGYTLLYHPGVLGGGPRVGPGGGPGAGGKPGGTPGDAPGIPGGTPEVPWGVPSVKSSTSG